MHAVGVGQERQPVGDRLQGRPEGVGRAANVPAETSRRDTAEDDALVPRLAHGVVNTVQAPEREQVRDRSATHPHQVARRQALQWIRRRLGKQFQFGHVTAGGVEGVVGKRVVIPRVTSGGHHETHPRAFLFRACESVEQHGPQSCRLLHGTRDVPTRGGQNSRSFHRTFLVGFRQRGNA